jgi:hypothetical protein
MSSDHFLQQFEVNAPYALEPPEGDSDPVRVGSRKRLVFWGLQSYAGAGAMPAYTDTGNPRQSGMANFLGVPALVDPQCNARQVNVALAQALANATNQIEDNFACWIGKNALFPYADRAQAQPITQVLMDLLRKEVGIKSPAQCAIGFHIGAV